MVSLRNHVQKDKTLVEDGAIASGLPGVFKESRRCSLPYPGFHLPDNSDIVDRIPAMRYALPVWSL
jgi:hypothetical protein